MNFSKFIILFIHSIYLFIQLTMTVSVCCLTISAKQGWHMTLRQNKHIKRGPENYKMSFITIKNYKIIKNIKINYKNY